MILQHFRNFVAELVRKGRSSGLEELSPKKIAYEVFQHLPNGSQIAITTRFGSHPTTRQYIETLQQRGFEVRLITNQTAVEDFCFLKSTQRELVGMVRSTFVVWAALLMDDNTTDDSRSASHAKARLYSVQSPHTIKKFAAKGKPIFRTYNWTHPKLQSRVFFELFTSEEMDAVSLSTTSAPTPPSG